MATRKERFADTIRRLQGELTVANALVESHRKTIVERDAEISRLKGDLESALKSRQEGEYATAIMRSKYETVRDMHRDLFDCAFARTIISRAR